LAIGKGSTEPCLDIVHACKGRKFVSIASPSVSLENGMSVAVMAKFVSSGLSQKIKAQTRSIKTKFIYGTTLKNNEVSQIIYNDFLPKALAAGSYIVAPKPYVIGTGLKYVQAGLDTQRKGVSAKKVVVSL
jgi:hypothetical protein